MDVKAWGILHLVKTKITLIFITKINYIFTGRKLTASNKTSSFVVLRLTGEFPQLISAYKMQTKSKIKKQNE
jgi:hypothetical protein